MSELKVQLESIKNKIQMMDDRYDLLLKEKSTLVERNEKLLEENKKSASVITELGESFKTVKLAKEFSHSKEDATIVKNKINEFIHEIDKCIALLNN
ncbi:MAG: hypothetical protein IIA45_10190 [Bacteroidetes bacterium]|nr:hypothetical protein [Bacteroidota bacterium]